MALLGHQIGKELCNALGLPKNTVGFSLHCRTNEIVTVECEYFPEGSFFVELTEFELVRKVPTAKPERESFSFDAWLSARKAAAHAAMLNEHRELSRMDQHLFCDG